MTVGSAARDGQLELFAKPPRILLAGDIHVKPGLIGRIDACAHAYEAEHIIIMGDYLDDWNASGELNLQSLKTILEWARSCGNVTLLIGNHDFGYIDGLGRHSGFDRTIADDAYHILFEYRDLLSIASSEGNWLFTHAGICAGWAQDAHIPSGQSADAMVTSLTTMLGDSNRHRLLTCAGQARGGTALYPGPLWADRLELLEAPYAGLNQVVGHSPVESCLAYTQEDGTRIVFCDTFSTRPNGTPIGDSSMVLHNSDRSHDVP